MTDRLLSESAVIAAVQAERLCDNTGCPTDIAYEQGLSDAIAAINALPDAREWQPIETAKRDGQEVMIYHQKYGAIRGSWRNCGCEYGELWAGTFMMPGLTADAQPTHWQPLPAPPEQDT